MKKRKIAIIGLGYVGLPLAVEFAKKYETIGFDIDEERINSLNVGDDKTREITKEELNFAVNKNDLKITSKTSLIKDCNIYIVTVPTPIDKNNRPLLTPLLSASETVGRLLKKDDIVVYESTVYPGATEEDCVPVLEKFSGLKFNVDFYVGYSPERINPGDKEHVVKNIVKVTSGSNSKTAEIVDDLYKSIINAGTFKASSIKVAEAAKVIENSQRDLNIAFVNELSKIFNLLKIDTYEVLEAASTKWNFLNFKPGLVGGHCIGVDPYYLAQKSMEVGYNPEIILAGRRMNDSMGKHVASETVKLMIKKGIKIIDSKILILGFTFKENCPDVRNTKVIDIINELETYGINVLVIDPLANPVEVENYYKIKIKQAIPENEQFDSLILAVGHNSFKELKIFESLKSVNVIYDVKGFLDSNLVDKRL